MFKNYLRENGFYRSQARDKKEWFIKHDDYIAGLYAYVDPQQKGVTFTYRAHQFHLSNFIEMDSLLNSIHYQCNNIVIRSKTGYYRESLRDSITF